MATNVDTQSYLDEAKTPSIQTLVQAKAALTAFRPEIGKLKRQSSLYRELLLGAGISEDDNALALELRAVQIELEGLESAVDGAIDYLRLIHEHGKRFKAADTAVRVTANSLGYTV